jgi:tetratricopeptide (TPR) repeat protein
MKTRNLLIGSLVAALLGTGAWLGWRWYATPLPPELRPGADREVVAVFEEARQEVLRQRRSGQAWGKLGMVLATNAHEQEALECFVQAERFDPHNPRWPYYRGILLMSSRPAQAIPLLRRALDRAPKQRAGILFRLAEAEIQDGQLEEAEQHLQALRAIEPDGPQVRFGLGLLCLARGDRAAARTHLSTLADCPFIRRRVCGMLATLTDGDAAAARTWQQRADYLPEDVRWPIPFETELSRCKVDRKSGMAQVEELQRLGLYPAALNLLRKLVQDSPDAEVCYTLGLRLYEKGELDEAVRMLRRAIDFEAGHAQAYYLLGDALLRQGVKRSGEPDGKEAAQELFRQAVAAEDRALALESTSGFAHLVRGRALKHLGRTDEAIAALREALLRRPEFADIHRTLGEALAEAGQVREGLEHLENAVRLAGPDDPRPRATLDRWRARANSSP